MNDSINDANRIISFSLKIILCSCLLIYSIAPGCIIPLATSTIVGTIFKAVFTDPYSLTHNIFKFEYSELNNKVPSSFLPYNNFLFSSLDQDKTVLNFSFIYYILLRVIGNDNDALPSFDS